MVGRGLLLPFASELLFVSLELPLVQLLALYSCLQLLVNASNSLVLWLERVPSGFEVG